MVITISLTQETAYVFFFWPLFVDLLQSTSQSAAHNGFARLMYSWDKKTQHAKDNQTTFSFGQCTAWLVTMINLFLMVLVFMGI